MCTYYIYVFRDVTVEVPSTIYFDKKRKKIINSLSFIVSS